jgi:glutaredoxin-like protein NrdH
MNRTVRMFALSTCSHCKATKKFLNDYRVQFECTDVDMLDSVNKAMVLDEVKKYNPRLTFPTIIIDGDRVIIWFQEDEIKKALDL